MPRSLYCHRLLASQANSITVGTINLGFDIDYIVPSNGIIFMSGHNEIKKFIIDGVTPPWYNSIRNCGHESGFVAGITKGQRLQMTTDGHIVLFIPIW